MDGIAWFKLMSLMTLFIVVLTWMELLHFLDKRQNDLDRVYREFRSLGPELRDALDDCGLAGSLGRMERLADRMDACADLLRGHRARITVLLGDVGQEPTARTPARKERKRFKPWT